MKLAKHKKINIIKYKSSIMLEETFLSFLNRYQKIARVELGEDFKM